MTPTRSVVFALNGQSRKHLVFHRDSFPLMLSKLSQSDTKALKSARFQLPQVKETKVVEDRIALKQLDLQTALPPP